jgi:hypothetical protein
VWRRLLLDSSWRVLGLTSLYEHFFFFSFFTSFVVRFLAFFDCSPANRERELSLDRVLPTNAPSNADLGVLADLVQYFAFRLIVRWYPEQWHDKQLR